MDIQGETLEMTRSGHFPGGGGGFWQGWQNVQGSEARSLSIW